MKLVISNIALVSENDKNVYEMMKTQVFLDLKWRQ